MEVLRLKVNDEIELIELRAEDAATAFRAIDKNRAFLASWLPWAHDIKTEEDEKKFIQSLKEAKNGEISFGVWHNGVFVGAIGLHAIDKKNAKSSIGYWLSEDANGKGIMTLSVKCLLRYCFEDLGLNRIFIGHAVQNKKSGAVIERCGFKKEGVLRAFEKIDNNFLDYVGYSMLASDFKSLTS